MGQVAKFQRTTEVDYDTGQVKKETTISEIKKLTEPPFVKMYIDDLSTFLNISDAPKNVLTLILRKLDYDGYIAISSRYKKEIASILGIKVQSVSNNITKLVKAGIMKNTSYGEYHINPNLFARGNWREVIEQRQSFDMIISYSEKGRKISMRKSQDEVQQEFDL